MRLTPDQTQAIRQRVRSHVKLEHLARMRGYFARLQAHCASIYPIR